MKKVLLFLTVLTLSSAVRATPITYQFLGSLEDVSNVFDPSFPERDFPKIGTSMLGSFTYDLKGPPEDRKIVISAWNLKVGDYAFGQSGESTTPAFEMKANITKNSFSFIDEVPADNIPYFYFDVADIELNFGATLSPLLFQLPIDIFDSGSLTLDGAATVKFNIASIQKVPEPATLALFGAALLGLAGRARRKS
ncbi:PEP-CTERM sorting domain-containing protein [Hahella sp. KA22]|uniref:PEP-CTERM sorting domain-containing protein n=1 Tax=Hahella sp. KA22 TaxID=1628392 RepID=UPI000FDCED16|nr:PEP-CTERM sorting domain-containing protein [Hahella sp. KA22]AZZ91052.1 PEP-CTERM sorting domain-containing protein [Hahella sp. KA22]QAY54422.1 PEP-CTERM sorting domain-containing protein [Hahella sp. KA22]